MPELNLRIFSRNYRLAVTPGEEPVLEQCAQRVDQHMEAIRSGGRVVALDQIAVLAALEIAYDDNKAQAALETKVAELEERVATQSATANEPELPLDMNEPESFDEPPQPEVPETTSSADISEEAEPAVPALVAASVDTSDWEKEIDDLCRLCEEAIYTSSVRSTGFF